MEDVPITFEHQGKTYSGFFSHVSGAGGTATFHLMIDNYFCGTLFYTDRWIFWGTPKTEGFKELENYFGGYVTAWFQ